MLLISLGAASSSTLSVECTEPTRVSRHKLYMYAV